MSDTNFGASYNDTGRNNLPILGKYRLPSDNAVFDHQHRRIIPHGIFGPPSGGNLVKKIYSEPDGALSFYAESSPDFPAFIFTEDFLTANILTFLDSAPVWPELDASENGRFHPEWLAHTELGRTLAYCHHLASSLVFEPEKFDLVSAEDFTLLDLRGECLRFMETLIRLSKASNLNPDDHAVHIRCLSFDCSPTKFIAKDGKSQPLYELQINRTDFCIEVFRKENRSLTQPITTFLFEYRDAVTVLLPVFERLRQLYALLYGVREIHNMGYRMNHETIEVHKRYLDLIRQE